METVFENDYMKVETDARTVKKTTLLQLTIKPENKVIRFSDASLHELTNVVSVIGQEGFKIAADDVMADHFKEIGGYCLVE